MSKYEVRVHEAVSTDIYTVEDVVVSQHFDGRGNHRLCIDYSQSDWKTAMGVSHLLHQGKTYHGTSEYYAGVLPRVFRCIGGTIPESG